MSEIVVDVVTGNVTERESQGLTLAEAQARDVQALADEARQTRDQLLAECDWTMLPDAPLTDTKRAAWISYRQALRAVTAQAGFPAEVNWPVAP